MGFHTISGNLVTDYLGFDVVCHGVNTVGVMGAGIARQFALSAPELLSAYREALSNKSLGVGKSFMFYGLPGDAPYKCVANIASQDRPGANARIEWLRDGVEDAIAQSLNDGFKHIGFPLIGAGIGGLDEADVIRELQEAAERHRDVEVTLVTYGPKGV